ncbi:hypothetical protein ACODM8_14130 [Vibrio ostreicida]|uniref:Methylamine utilization protein n=1 Tax=Vibrio ostreicida TaxID=526588 RepID=A0ABT8BSY9_9VIBR|nr:hypothetical protein [Vibrio ostreicida]MDN3610277.1 hypothetical protein [Vibrio ostreicida]NPD07708.1 hypothetical protein [Vibrio ostreicida]
MRLWFFLACFLNISSTLATPLEVTVLQNNGRPLQQAVVTVTSASLPSDRSLVDKKSPPEIAQDGQAFSPYISVVQVGEPVVFTNKDTISHHIYALTGPLDFSFVIRATQAGIEKTFSSQGTVAMGCNIHDWMSGYIKVVNTPYYGQTSRTGRVDLDIPDRLDEATLSVWHPQMNETLQIPLPNERQVKLTLSKKMSPIPKQKNTQKIDFYGSYQ